MDIIVSNGINLLIFAAILGVLVFVHELGHFAVAKRLGIPVLEFGFGFPPRVWRFMKRGENFDPRPGSARRGDDEFYSRVARFLSHRGHHAALRDYPNDDDYQSCAGLARRACRTARCRHDCRGERRAEGHRQ